MAVNKIVLNTDDGEQVLVDLTGDSVSEGKLFEGETAHAANGEKIVGAFTLESEMSEQDALIEQIKTALEGKVAGGGATETVQVNIAYSGMTLFIEGVIESTSPTTEYVETQILGENITELKVLKGSMILFKMGTGYVDGNRVIELGMGMYQIKAIDDVYDINLYYN